MAFRGRKTIAVIFNRNSGKNTPRFGYGRIVADILTTPRYSYDATTLGELKQTARRIHADRPDIIAVAGGDGTLGLDVTRILREFAKTPGMPLPQFLVIPTGTRNVVAANLGITAHSAVDFAKRIRHKIDHPDGSPFETAGLNPLKVNDQYGFLYGSGMPAHAVRHYYERADYRCTDSHRKYGLGEFLMRVKRPCRFTCKWDAAGKYDGRCPKCGEALERALGDERFYKVIRETVWDEIKAKILFRESQRLLTKPVYAEVELPEGHDPPFAPFMEYTGIMCSSVVEMSKGFKAMPDARQKKDHFMLRCTNLGFWGMASNLPFMWGGLPMPTSSVFDAVIPRLVIKYKAPTVRMIDGDLNLDNPATFDRIESGPLLAFIVG